MPEPGACEVEMVIERQKRNKSPGIDQIPAEMMKTGSRTIRYEIPKLIYSIWNKEELPEGWKDSIVVPIYKKDDKTDFSNYKGMSLCETRTKFHPTSCSQGQLHMQKQSLGIINVDFDATGQTLITYSAFVVNLWVP